MSLMLVSSSDEVHRGDFDFQLCCEQYSMKCSSNFNYDTKKRRWKVSTSHIFIHLPRGVKLKSGGSSLPLTNLVVRLPQFVKENVSTGLDWRDSARRRVLQQKTNKVGRLRLKWSLSEYLEKIQRVSK